ncbi:type I-B CRISPR-associated protein Cas7/Cst2/DevR [Vitiosangium sp. GDMCC 1.1324]|uniref:type I-B CRISPR-associated protein Cas7/Cst2/DevR n=1 Tax=Vitiosangium sp. (strain GDMCC 1.1324) TaxID=2138576 RepID=UPI000D3BA733|nr:type I-B CRISPR-associated protein Cas7/Cst2/DevR [Vitiosangium sp. GDMCC 1.1324]PTL82528.1 type I-B CRISPR-associated protein Cas7/Cst2/DevR [Vitiosangium sp. GDMCC 1.1324]
MSLHVFAAFVTANGTAANNRGLTEGNITTLQKLVWNGQVHTTVSAEAIRFALRRLLAEKEPCNRTFDDAERLNEWKDPQFKAWGDKAKGDTFIDDDLLGFMAAEAGKQEGEKGGAKVRRAVLEVTRAVSLTPWPGDVTFNAASPGATPSAQKKGSNPVPYGTEMHATRYQYGMALTPSALRVPARAATALRALCALGPVAGNQGRFLFDFSPESAVFRITHEAAPRILHAFQVGEGGGVSLTDLLRKVRGRDIPAKELVLGGAVVEGLGVEERELLSGAELHAGVLAACEAVCKRLEVEGK